MLQHRRTIPVILLVLIVAVIGFAFAAANTVENSNAGDGSGEISGYNVTDIQYVMDVEDPYLITSIGMKVTPMDPASGTGVNASSVKIQLETGGAWITCTGNNTSQNWVCPVGDGTTTYPVVDAVQLRVVAVQ